MSNLPTRRGFLAITGTGTAASLAGCSQLESITQEGSENPDEAVTVTVQPEREELQRLEEEIRADLDEGTLSQQEAGRVFRERQVELTEAAVASFEESVAGSELSVAESRPEYGLLRVTGPDVAIMESLRNGDVSGIYPGERYELIVQQQQQREQRQEMLEQQQEAQETDGETNESDAGNETDGTDAGNETDE
ncbi:hypothetical protein [Natrinema salaciae]|uniref:Uncharacterized protein n=1 Tax=Natrinema salaciae TaxID=1186196 RepID=A0A1H9BCC2_9EURY|nr:hypothetical protein [Natrinema salaciae]SEP86519.1 hypothetical protein SAMN04489841_0700 [Natrinema salaciae]